MKNLNLIRQIAWDFSKKTNLNYKDLFSEAALAYCEAVRKFDPSRGNKLITFAYWCIKNQLINYCKKETAIENKYLTESQWPEEFKPPAQEAVDFFELMETWPEEARQVAQLILQEPEKYMAATPNFRRWHVGQKRRLNKVKKDLRRQGWQPEKIQTAVSQIQQQLQLV